MSEKYWYNTDIKPLAQNLRKNMTAEERHLWYDFLKGLPVVVKRQKIIQNYIADFYIPSTKTVIELDGSQHYSEEGLVSDSVRNEAMQQLGITVLRYSNADINLRFEAVCEDIRNHLIESLPNSLPDSLPRMGKVSAQLTDEVIAEAVPKVAKPKVLTNEVIDEEDAFCTSLYNDYLNSESKGEAVSLEDYAKSLGITLH